MNGFTKKVSKKVSNSSSFTSRLDDRGRVVIPAKIRNKFNLKFNSLVLLDFKKKINGRSSVMVDRASIRSSVSVCGAEGAGSNPAYGPINKNKKGDNK